MITLKYIEYNNDDIIFILPHMNHSSWASKENVKSAGFINIATDHTFTNECISVHGESTALGIKSNPDLASYIISSCRGIK